MSILGKILQRENVIASIAVITCLSGAYLYFFHDRHILLTATRGGDTAYVKMVMQDGVPLIEQPIRFKIQNFGEGPIKINDFRLGYQPNNGDCTESMMAIGLPFPLENDGLLQASENISQTENLQITPAFVGSNLCVAATWQTQFGEAKSTLMKIGSIDSIIMPPAAIAVGDRVAMSLTLEEVTSIFGPTKCLRLLSSETCL